MDERARILLTEIIQRHIADGAPIGARALSRNSELHLSTASISNFMADLEEEGLLISPRASAGRVPTAKGYRYYVDSVLSKKTRWLPPLAGRKDSEFESLLIDEPRRLAEQVAEMLSCSSHFVGVVALPRQSEVFRHIEFLALGDKRILVIVVSPNGNVQNRVIVTTRSYSQQELANVSNILNSQYAGRRLDEVGAQLKNELAAMGEEIRALMSAALAPDRHANENTPSDLVIAGRKNLLDVSEFENDISSLRKLFDLFEEKAELMRLMESSDSADGIGVFIGGTTDDERYRDVSIISAPFVADGKAIGLLGVIGPTRMPYEALIGLVGRASQLVRRRMNVPTNN